MIVGIYPAILVYGIAHCGCIFFPLLLFNARAVLSARVVCSFCFVVQSSVCVLSVCVLLDLVVGVVCLFRYICCYFCQVLVGLIKIVDRVNLFTILLLSHTYY